MTRNLNAKTFDRTLNKHKIKKKNYSCFAVIKGFEKDA